ncbi:unnamed protein product [Dicrocoelium dendriticum]|nr:unnamed protein product [Dicrocoelium dendriticum]
MYTYYAQKLNRIFSLVSSLPSNSPQQHIHNGSMKSDEQNTLERYECVGHREQVERETSVPSRSHCDSSKQLLPHWKMDSPTRAPSSNAVSYQSDFSDSVAQTEIYNLNDDSISSKHEEPGTESEGRMNEKCNLTNLDNVPREIASPRGQGMANGSFLSEQNRHKFNPGDSERGTNKDPEVVCELSRQFKLMKVRPPWRDPNSKPLPSDRTASLYDLYEQFSNNTCSAMAMTDLSRLLNRGELAVCRPYHATLNRHRQLERIQMENYNLAKRLQRIRPSPGMTRAEQLREYKRYFIPPSCFVVRATALPRRPETSVATLGSGISVDRHSGNPKPQRRLVRQVGSAQAYYKRSDGSTGEQGSTSSSQPHERARVTYTRLLEKAISSAAIGPLKSSKKQRRSSHQEAPDTRPNIRCAKADHLEIQKVPGHPIPPPPSPTCIRSQNSRCHRALTSVRK